MRIFNLSVYVKRTESLLSCGQIDLKKSVSAVLLLGQRSYFCWIANSRRVYRHLVIIEHGVSADKRERKQKKTPIFTFKKFPRPLKRECPLTGMSKYRV